MWAPSQCARPPAAPVGRRTRGLLAVPVAVAVPQPPPVSTATLQETPAWVARHAQNPALRGNYAPVQNEVTVHSLVVDGQLPPCVDGVYLRNGPNPRFEPTAYHWFDGTGMVHYLRLRGRDNTAEYGCRYVRTRGFEEEERAGRRLHMSLTQAPKPGPILRGMLSKGAQPGKAPDSPYWVIQSPNNANNGIRWHAGRLLATYEAGSAYELRLCRDLTTLGVCSFGKGGWNYFDHWTENFTAHSKVCPVTGELVYLGYNLVPFGGPPTVTVGVLSADGALAHKATIPVARPSMQHDVGITTTRTVLLDGPLVFNLSKAAAGGRPFNFLRGEPLRFGILPRHGGAGDVVWIEAEGCFSYHVANCWDDPTHPDRVVVVLCRMRETRALGMADPVQRHGDGSHSVTHEAGPDAQPFVEEAYLHRYVLDTRTRSVVESAPLCALPCDFPCVSPQRVGRPTRFAFSAGERTMPGDAMTNFDALLKHDLDTGDVVRRPLPPGTLCGDVSFVPRHESTVGGEGDDGYVLLLTHVLEEDRAELLVLDARDILAPPAAVVHIPVRVPFGFHCEWVPGPIDGW